MDASRQIGKGLSTCRIIKIERQIALPRESSLHTPHGGRPPGDPMKKDDTVQTPRLSKTKENQ
ncbi:hypothetical protein GCM10007276_15880 [Agaricicola taiwanensis]|uniref:Uncharacterized protein n=1 Tax=Agaricicola taiwanensis TaxID=591372 RepID=A0A8J2YGI5_9RHOB|nr:hypothetical protein GCM10007276_15880 [Agaricicola taiwanensis]